MRTIKTIRWCVISGRDVPPGALLSLTAEVAEALIAAGDAEGFDPLAYRSPPSGVAAVPPAAEEPAHADLH